MIVFASDTGAAHAGPGAHACRRTARDRDVNMGRARAARPRAGSCASGRPWRRARPRWSCRWWPRCSRTSRRRPPLAAARGAAARRPPRAPARARRARPACAARAPGRSASGQALHEAGPRSRPAPPQVCRSGLAGGRCPQAPAALDLAGSAPIIARPLRPTRGRCACLRVQATTKRSAAARPLPKAAPARTSMLPGGACGAAAPEHADGAAEHAADAGPSAQRPRRPRS